MKIDRVFNSKEEKETEEKFYKAIMTLSNLDEHKAFFNDICTVSYTHLTLPTKA